jgi:S-DNA-T family DNA segregation ATPase FtsK/SpoIIIE
MTMQAAMNDVLIGLGIDGTCVRAEAHRHLAFYDVALELRNGAVSKLKKRETAEAIAMALKTKTVPIMRLIPAEGVVRLQVALKDAEPVGLMDLYEGEWLPEKMVFPMLLGEDDEGSKMWMDMNHNPHLLVAGGTGSGKSTLLHTLIANALYVHALRTRNVWLYLGDPKRVEFTDYEVASRDSLKGIIRQVASSYDDVILMLKDLYNMMELRYKMLQQYKMRSIEENPQKFPLVLCVIDEVSDLMGQQGSKKELEQLLVKLAQKGRAAGIFLVLSTQRPSVDVITGLIKANFPGRIACKTASRKDSEVVLDRPGAETLLGRGDAVLQNMKHESVRFQVAYTSPQETIANFNWLTRVAS